MPDLSKAIVSGPGAQQTFSGLGVIDFTASVWKSVGYAIPDAGDIALCLTDNAGNGSIGPFIPAHTIRDTSPQVMDTTYGSSSLAGLQLYRGWLVPNGTGANNNVVVRIGRDENNSLLVGLNSVNTGVNVGVIYRG